MDVMLPGGLLGWGLIVRDRQEGLRSEARADRLASEARKDRSPSWLAVVVRRVVASCSGTGTGTREGTDR